MKFRVSNLSTTEHREANWRGGCGLWGPHLAFETFGGTYSPKWAMLPGEVISTFSSGFQTKRNNPSSFGQPAAQGAQ